MCCISIRAFLISCRANFWRLRNLATSIGSRYVWNSPQLVLSGSVPSSAIGINQKIPFNRYSYTKRRTLIRSPRFSGLFLQCSDSNDACRSEVRDACVFRYCLDKNQLNSLRRLRSCAHNCSRHSNYKHLRSVAVLLMHVLSSLRIYNGERLMYKSATVFIDI